MNCKVFNRSIFLLLLLLSLTTVYFSAFSKINPKIKCRIDNFSNVHYRDISNIQIEAKGPLKKVLLFNLHSQEHALILEGASSVIKTTNYEKNGDLVEHIIEPQIQLKEKLDFSDYCLSESILKAQNANLCYKAHTLFLDVGSLQTKIQVNNRIEPIQINFKNCTLMQTGSSLFKAFDCDITAQNLAISCKELYFEDQLLHMKGSIKVTVNNDGNEVKTITAERLTFDPKTQLINLFADLNHLVTFHDQKKSTTMKTKHLQIDCSNGIKQACIKSNSTVECHFDKTKKKTIKQYFSYE